MEPRSMDMETLVKMTGQKLVQRFPHTPPPIRKEGPAYDSIGRPVWYPAFAAGKGQVMDSTCPSSYSGSTEPDPDEPWLKYAGELAVLLHGVEDPDRRRAIIREYRERKSRLTPALAPGEKPQVCRQGRDYTAKPIMLDHVDPYGRVIRCRSRKQAMREAERHGCRIKAGPGEM